MGSFSSSDYPYPEPRVLVPHAVPPRVPGAPSHAVPVLPGSGAELPARNPRRARVFFFSGKTKIQRGEATSKGRGRQHLSQVRQGAQKLHVAVFLHLLRRTGGFPSAFRALFPLFFPSLSGYHHARPSKEQMPAAPPRGGGGTAEPPASRCPPASGCTGGDGNESGQGRKFHVSTSRNGR